ncbi:MAG: DNA polymerase II large subunit, partial [Halobacteriota archaeon]
GVVAAPIEGIDRVAVEPAPDGGSFVRIWYAGPIRSAGGTAQALSVLVADYARSLLGLDAYRPTDAEVARTVEEVELYERETGLQYAPSATEVEHIARSCPVMLDGEPTTEGEVDSYRDLERIDTNRGRGGMCLVLAEGIAQKADKLARYVDALEAVQWPWLDDLRDEPAAEDETSGTARLGPNAGYLKDLIAGRPVLAHPSEAGGFRLRYGRARNHGLATAGVHPATMRLLDDFIAPGTQLKTERPGKAAGVVPVDTIAGPTVRLGDGSVQRLEDPEVARELRGAVVEIIDLGEYLVNVGEFVENNQPLLPGAYDRRRWALEMERAGADLQALRDDPAVDIARPDPEAAISWATDHGAPLHPRFTYAYHDLEVVELEAVADAIERGEVTEGGLRIPAADGVAEALGRLLVPHEVDEDHLLVPTWRPLARTLGFDDALTRDWDALDGDDPIAAVNAVAPYPVRPLAPTRIGARMGRPEKSEPRELSPAVHGLFPVGAAGGDRRSLEEAASFAPQRGGPAGEIEVELNRRVCPECGAEGYLPRCDACGTYTEAVYTCPACDIPVEADESDRRICPRCEREASCVVDTVVDVEARFEAALENVGVRRRTLEIVKGVKGLTSEQKTPEPLEKAVLRAANDITVFKDGTTRYDMTDLPVTAVRPAEVGVDAETFRELGFETDVDGEPLRYDDQLVELGYQDVILSEDAGEYLLRTANFVDDLLEEFYDLEPFYRLTEPDDLVGELVLGLAPHTSAAVVGRIVGFTSASVGYSHPFFHASKRRNCDGDEDCVMLLMDGLLNFSETYLPSSRGGRMDAPLVLSTRIDPSEIDDEAHNIETASEYPLELYEMADRYGDPEAVGLPLAKDDVDAGREPRFGHTDDPTDIAMGPDLSAYKTLESMEDKLSAQLELARKLRGVDEADVAERVIEGHYLPDLLGNLRAFASQEVRCRDCGKKYRRVPLTGSCHACGGTVSLTVYEGMVTKYLEAAIEIAERYEVRPYTRQRLEVLEYTLASLFEDDTDRQAGIADFM